MLSIYLEYLKHSGRCGVRTALHRSCIHYYICAACIIIRCNTVPTAQRPLCVKYSGYMPSINVMIQMARHTFYMHKLLPENANYGCNVQSWYCSPNLLSNSHWNMKITYRALNLNNVLPFQTISQLFNQSCLSCGKIFCCVACIKYFAQSIRQFSDFRFINLYRSTVLQVEIKCNHSYYTEITKWNYFDMHVIWFWLIHEHKFPDFIQLELQLHLQFFGKYKKKKWMDRSTDLMA